MRPDDVLSTSHLWPHTAWPSYTILIAKSDRCHILIIIVITTSDGNSLESDQKKSRLEKKFKHGKILDMKILVLYNYKNWKLSVSHIIHYCYYMNVQKAINKSLISDLILQQAQNWQAIWEFTHFILQIIRGIKHWKSSLWFINT